MKAMASCLHILCFTANEAPKLPSIQRPATSPKKSRNSDRRRQPPAGALKLWSRREESRRSGHVGAAVAYVSVEVGPAKDHISLVEVNQSVLRKVLGDAYTLPLPHLLVKHHVSAALCLVADRLRISELRVLGEPRFELFVVAPVPAGA